MKSIINGLVTGDQILVVVNSLPLYMIVQMFFDSDQIGMTQQNLTTTGTNTPQ